MNILHEIWLEIRQGENIDLYATIIIAFGLVVLSMFGKAPPDIVASLTLTVLGLLAISNLVNRHRVEAVLKQAADTNKPFFLDTFPPDYQSNFEQCDELWIVE